MSEIIKVLIVDDEARACESMAAVLLLDRTHPEFSFSVEKIVDPDKLLDILEFFEPHVVLLDIRFGDNKKRGLKDLLPRIAGYLMNETAVIMVTAHRGADTDQIVEALGWQVSAFLDKQGIEQILVEKVVEAYRSLQGVRE